MLNVLAALLGGAGSIAGGIMGANAQDSANETNMMINLMNYFSRERERQDAIEQAGKIRREDKLGGTDAAGNSTYFVPGKGWVTNLTPENAGIQQSQRREQERVLNSDLPMLRRANEANYKDRLQDRELEEKYIKELPYAKVDPGSIRSMLFADAREGIDGSFDESTAAALRGANRRGMSGIDKILSSFARQRADATGDAFQKTGVQAMQLADQMSRQNTGQLQGLINFFGGRARGLPAVNYKPDNTDDAANNLMKSFLSAAQNSEGLSVNAAGKQGGTIDYTQPNMGYANTMVQGGNALANLLKSFGSQQNYNDSRSRYNASNSYG